MDQPDGDELRPLRSGESAASNGVTTEPTAERAASNGPITEGVRIAAVEAAVAAGMAPSTTRAPEVPRSPAWPAPQYPEADLGGRHVAAGPVQTGPWQYLPGEYPPAAETPGYVLQDWSDPPTGQVPRVLLDEPVEDLRGDGFVPPLRGPSWREVGSDWDDDGDGDLSFLGDGHPAPAPDPNAVAGDPFGFSFADFADPAIPPTWGDDPAVARAAAWQAGEWGEPDWEETAGGTEPGVPGGAADPRLVPAGSDEDAAWSQLLAHPVPGDAEPGLSDLGQPPRRRHASRARFGRRGRGRAEALAELTGVAPPSPLSAYATPSAGAAPAAGAAQAAGAVPAASATRAAGATQAAGLIPAASAPQAAGATPAAAAAASRPDAGTARSPVLAVLTGCIVGAVALVCFLGGPLPTLLLVAVLVTLAAGETLAALRRSGARPAAPVALLAPPALMVAAYLRGVGELPIVLAAALLLSWFWFLFDPARRAPTAALGATVLVIGWVGLLAAFAAALLAPGTFPARHGLAVLVAAVLLAIGNDVGAYAVGSRFGRHKLAPVISPGKTWEGLAGGVVLTLLLAAFVASRIYPLDLERAMQLGLVVCVLAPLGDLAESMLKRDLGLKDMGDLLPAHGGVLDRIDSLLFVLPVAYCLAVAWHLR
jgi:CDP-diglyceride synthetase